MITYEIKYSTNANAIPEGAIKLKKQMDNIGTVYLVHHKNGTVVYLDYSIGIKIDKPTILQIGGSNGVVQIDIRRPDKGVVNKVNYHCFKIEFSGRVENVNLMEYI